MQKKSLCLFFMFLLLSGCQTLPIVNSPLTKIISSTLDKTTIVIKDNQLDDYSLKCLTENENYFSERDEEYQVWGNNIFIKGTSSQRDASLPRVSWGNERFSSSKINEEYQITKNNKDDYVLKLDIKTNRDVNILSGLSALLLFTPQLLGIPEWEYVTVSISAELTTRYGTVVKNYTSQGTPKRNIAGIFYGYSVIDAFSKSQQESFNEAFLNLIEQINNDKDIKKEAQKKLSIDEKFISELKNITGGKKVYDMHSVDNMTGEMLKRGSVIYFYRVPYMFADEKMGLFAGQNVHNGNLADFYHRTNYGLNKDIEKIFLYGKSDYIDGSNIEGYYKYVGNYNYVTILGARKTVPALKKVNIGEQHRKYFKFINDN